MLAVLPLTIWFSFPDRVSSKGTLLSAFQDVTFYFIAEHCLFEAASTRRRSVRRPSTSQIASASAGLAAPAPPREDGSASSRLAIPAPPREGGSASARLAVPSLAEGGGGLARRELPSSRLAAPGLGEGAPDWCSYCSAAPQPSRARRSPIGADRS